MAQGEWKSFLPDFCGVRMVMAVVLGAVVLAVIVTLASIDQLAAFWSRFSLTALYILWIALVSAAVICLLRRWLGGMGHGLAGLVAWLLVLAVCAAVAEITAWLLPVELVAGVEHRELLARTLGIGGILGALVLRYLYELHQQRQRELAENQARYQALQARIRPHFLFNSLNTVISLISSDPARAQQVLHDLSDLFRAGMAAEGQQSTLEEELALVRQYLEVEQLRLGERLRVRWELNELPMQARLPMLLLQPLVENAVYHGVEPSPDGGEVVLFGSCRKGRLQLAVSNTLPPGGEKVHRRGNRMALENIRQRLQALFGEAAGLGTGMVDGRYQVRIWLPVEEVSQ